MEKIDAMIATLGHKEFGAYWKNANAGLPSLDILAAIYEGRNPLASEQADDPVPRIRRNSVPNPEEAEPRFDKPYAYGVYFGKRKVVISRTERNLS